MTKESIYDRVTRKIIADLENGVAPWVQPWSGDQSRAGRLPANFHTERSYSGINILLLWGAAQEHGFTDNRWLTFKQALDLGGNVRKGEKGSHVVYVGKFTPKAEQLALGEDARQVPFLKSYCVFNIDQCDGIARGETAAPMTERAIHERAEALIAATGADFRIGGDKAFYVPSEDFIRVPPQPSFFEQINYYRTCFHELGHWTGHKSRLERDMRGKFGDTGYAREELVAEMCAAFVCASLDITPTVRHADYIGSWLEVLKSDSRAIFNAASLASKAADYILKADPLEQIEPEAFAIAAE